MGSHPPSDDVLVQYLLGTLSEADTERLDERSVSDDDVAQRLEAVENDLVDSYVRGALDGERRARFETYYLSTARGQEKLRFAEALRAAPPRRISRPIVATRWLLAAAAIVVVVTGGILVIQQTRDTGGVPTTSVSQPQVTDVPKTPPSAPVAPPGVSQAPPEGLVVAFALPPARRGIARSPQITVPAGATEVLLRLELEGDDFPEYAAVVKDAATGRITHEVTRLRSRASGASRIVSVSVPPSSIPAADGIVELTGVAPGKPAEPLSTYPFRVVAR